MATQHFNTKVTKAAKLTKKLRYWPTACRADKHHGSNVIRKIQHGLDGLRHGLHGEEWVAFCINAGASLGEVP